MRDVFVSGWCGFPELFGNFADRFDFVVPFCGYDEQDVVKLLETSQGKNLVCWSTGANLALKACKLEFENIVLIAPFIRFTDYTPERVLKLMIKKFRTAPHEVINDFITACGCSLSAVLSEYGGAGEGLEYLLNSGEGIQDSMPAMTILHGTEDSIVNISAGREIAVRFGSRFVPVEAAGHFISPEKISEYLV
ncbi:alpha/beta fold hydrolase [Seleniivibrio woodruffii]|uniref:alpha/beta fold hydrolase n=1 Tax=Seleniivibrio woodruffii TaxID=1078050 RepID=UPI002409E6E4|nr:alpha/beta hydrolase [Seleniivibrio woodruffii]